MTDNLEIIELFCENCEKPFLPKDEEPQNCPYCNSPLWVVEVEKDHLS